MSGKGSLPFHVALRASAAFCAKLWQDTRQQARCSTPEETAAERSAWVAQFMYAWDHAPPPQHMVPPVPRFDVQRATIAELDAYLDHVLLPLEETP